MGTGATPEGTQDSDGTRGAERAAGVPPAPDRPFVDGTTRSSEEIREEVRSEVEVLADERRRQIEELREAVADTVEELVGRMDVPARLRAGKDETVTAARRRVDRAPLHAGDGASTAVRAVRERPGAVTASVAVLLLVLLGRRWYAARRAR